MVSVAEPLRSCTNQVGGGGGEEARMLVLDRKVQQGFWIEGRIYVKVLGIGRRRVKLGIDAPGEVAIVREELWSPPASEGSAHGGLPAPNGQALNEGSFRTMRRGT